MSLSFVKFRTASGLRCLAGNKLLVKSFAMGKPLPDSLEFVLQCIALVFPSLCKENWKLDLKLTLSFHLFFHLSPTVGVYMNRAFIPSKLVNFLLASEEETHFAHREILLTRMALEYAVPSPRSLCCRDGRTLPRAFPLVSAPCHRQWWSPSPQPAFFSGTQSLQPDPEAMSAS